MKAGSGKPIGCNGICVSPVYKGRKVCRDHHRCYPVLKSPEKKERDHNQFRLDV